MTCAIAHSRPWRCCDDFTLSPQVRGGETFSMLCHARSHRDFFQSSPAAARDDGADLVSVLLRPEEGTRRPTLLPVPLDASLVTA
jgi:hypothetical protein